jgi:hypothetical protein
MEVEGAAVPSLHEPKRMPRMWSGEAAGLL